MNHQDMIKYFMEIPPEKSFKDQLIDITKMMKIPLKSSVTYSSYVKVEYKVGKHRTSVIGDSESVSIIYPYRYIIYYYIYINYQLTIINNSFRFI